jgi:hypothetical protein
VTEHPSLRAFLDRLYESAGKRPIELDISDWSDEWCAGFLAGQENALEAVMREVDRDA